MDSNEVKKRLVNDVTAPQVSSATTTLDVKKRQTITVTDSSQPQVDSLLPPAEFTAEQEQAIATAPAEKVIAPPPDLVVPAEETIISQPVEPEVAQEASPADVPLVDPLPEQTPVVKAAQVPTPVPDDKDVPVADIYEASDALPDDNTRAASDIKDGMQDPKLYDTTAYHVPIKETHHGHGSTKAALAFGAVFALVVVGGALYFMFRIGS